MTLLFVGASGCCVSDVAGGFYRDDGCNACSTSVSCGDCSRSPIDISSECYVTVKIELNINDKVKVNFKVKANVMLKINVKTNGSVKIYVSVTCGGQYQDERSLKEKDRCQHEGQSQDKCGKSKSR
ncbi:Hypothetical predicted protein [Octopus vulgaris]|uniref:Uncharacterized protein n=1 Tax=Octopus vulgaris TaxID=6645 RepID=A0AA36FJ72_OCTVU|nr:Hypothetical predicted protein [Octopus vulgaris]